MQRRVQTYGVWVVTPSERNVELLGRSRFVDRAAKAFLTELHTWLPDRVNRWSGRDPEASIDAEVMHYLIDRDPGLLKPEFWMPLGKHRLGLTNGLTVEQVEAKLPRLKVFDHPLLAL